jgi:hypothetical protein
MGAIGMLASFFVTPWLGGVADEIGHGQLPEAETVAIFEQVSRDFPGIAASAGAQAADIQAVVNESNAVLDSYRSNGELPTGDTAQALRGIIGSGVDSPVVARSSAILNPADNYGGRLSFRTLAPIGFILIFVFAGLFIRDRMTGGYKAEKLTAAGH